MSDRRDRRITFRSGPGTGEPTNVGDIYTVGDQIIYFFDNLHDSIQAIVLRTGPREIRVLKQTNEEEILDSYDMHIRPAGRRGVDYDVGVPVIVKVHIPVLRETGVITAKTAVPGIFQVTLDGDNSVLEVPLNNLVFSAPFPASIPQVQAFGNVQIQVPIPVPTPAVLSYLGLTEAEYLALTEEQYLELIE